MKYFLIAIFLCILSACGFQPMYSYEKDSNIQTITETIFIKPIVGINGIDMRNYLRSLLNPYGDPTIKKYELNVNLQSPQEIYKGIDKTGTATWIDVKITAVYELKNLETNKIIFKGTDSSFESYPVVQDLIAATSSKDSATENAVRILSETIGTKIQTVMKNEIQNK